MESVTQTKPHSDTGEATFSNQELEKQYKKSGLTLQEYLAGRNKALGKANPSSPNVQFIGGEIIPPGTSLDVIQELIEKFAEH